MSFPWETEEFFKHRDEARKRFPVPPKTNADRIRSMTDKELAEFLNTVNSCVCSYAMGKSPCDGKDCPCWLSWLKSEAEDGDK